MKKNKSATKKGQRDDEKSSRPFLTSTKRPIITLLTDFGASDYFVAAMKGVILSINPDAEIIDITHEVPPQDVETAAFTLLVARRSFPKGSIHVAVVDPGVGSSRRPMVMEAQGQYFVGPDNGVFSYIGETEKNLRVFHLTNSDFFLQPVSSTFNGRDIFAPVAAAISRGMPLKELGGSVIDYVRLPPLQAEKKGSTIKGRIVHIDRFGNCITNITTAELTPAMQAAGVVARVGKSTIRSLRKFFADSSNEQEKVFMIWGSAGFLELAAQNKSAARLLKVERGMPITISPS